ncbi:helicase associated domain-containing protein [Streptomyces sp. NPDC001691]|uniref:helicase associated domain-containing protein n=1 Tax=Streptomyces sp. NPDC001691 TaxID=3364600 RepID=UPI003673B201
MELSLPAQRAANYRAFADLVDADGHLPGIASGVTFDGDDIGRWLQQQKQPNTWAQLSSEQQERLTALGIKAEAPSPVPAASRTEKGPAKAQQAFQWGLAP